MARAALVCDDDPLLRDVVMDLATDLGLRPFEATTAIDAIALAGVLHPAIVVMDVALVGMSGLEAIPRILTVSPTTQVVVLSAFDQARDLCLHAGACDVVLKHDLERLGTVLHGLAAAAPPDVPVPVAPTPVAPITTLAPAATEVDVTDGLARLFDDFFGAA